MPSVERIVLDTSTLVGALLKPHSLPAQALQWAWQVAQPIASNETLDELERVLARDQFDRYRPAADRQTFLSLYRAMCEMVDVDAPVQVCRDPRDDKFLSLAAAGAARVLISSDQDLLVLRRFQGTTTLRPGDFVQLCVGDET